MKFIYDFEFEQDLIKQLQKKGSFTSDRDKIMLDEIIPTKPSGSFIEEHVKIIEKNWNKLEDNFLKKLGFFYEKKLEKPEKMNVMLVRFSAFPYNFHSDPPLFAAPLFSYPVERNRVIMHELIHYYQPFESDRSFKEAIPVILNSGDFGLCNFDKGQSDSEEQKWRDKIFEHYKNGGTISGIKPK